MNETPTVLTITSLSTSRSLLRYRYTMSGTGDPSEGPVERPCEVSVSAELVKIFTARLRSAAEKTVVELDPQERRREIESCGQALHQLFFPRHDVRIGALLQRLRRLRVPLLITTDDPEVPWELLYDEDAERQFGEISTPGQVEADGMQLGGGSDSGRRHQASSDPSRVAAAAGSGWRCLMVADPNQGDRYWELPEAAQEAQRLATWLEARGIERLDYLEGPEATIEAVSDKLLHHAYDLVHFSGHVTRIEKRREYALRLRNGAMLTASDVRALFRLRGTPIVFLNGCESARTVDGLAGAFLDVGAQIVIGSRYAVPDEGARVFAETFYEQMLGGASAGEAMRMARLHTRDVPACGGPWACFVMYGNPCFTVDEIGRLLATVGLARRRLELPATQVLDRAIQLGRRVGQVLSEHVLAALPEREHLRLHPLDSRDRTPVAVDRLFPETFGTAVAASAPTGSPALSESTGEMLRVAEWIASSRHATSLITTLDLSRAIIAMGGGDIEHRLRASRVRLTWRDRGKVDEPTPCPVHWLPAHVSRDVCTPSAWEALSLATVLAGTPERPGIVDSESLWQGLRGVRHGAASRALRRIGLDGDVRAGHHDRLAAWEQLTNAESGRGCRRKPRCSADVRQIVDLAYGRLVAGGRTRLSDHDLLVGFVRQGGGPFGQRLQSDGLILDSLTSALFSDDGGLDRWRFDQTANAVLERGLAIARARRHLELDWRHLLYGLLTTPGDHATAVLAYKGHSRDRLLDLLTVGMVPGPGCSRLEVRVSDMRPELVRILCAAEAAIAARRDEVIYASDLLRALIGDPGRNAAAFLAEAAREM